MWIKCPEGVEAISVERQNFTAEVQAGGRSYFRAPDHFAPLIFATGLGFSQEEPPLGATDLADFPKIDPLRDGTISEQTSRIQALETTLSDLRTELSICAANLSAALAERDDLKLKLHETNVKLSDLEDEAQDLRDAANKPPVGRK